MNSIQQGDQKLGWLEILTIVVSPDSHNYLIFENLNLISYCTLSSIEAIEIDKVRISHDWNCTLKTYLLIDFISAW